MTVVNVTKTLNYDSYVGRPGKWGNPFQIMKGRNREQAVRLYINYIMNNQSLLKDIRELRGQSLGCHCAPKLCHGHVLEWLANDMTDETYNDLFSFNQLNMRSEIARFLEELFFGATLETSNVLPTT